MATTKTLKELALSRGPAFDDYATPEDRAALLKAPRASHNGAYSESPNPLAIKRATYIKELLNGRTPANEKSVASLEALRKYLENFQIKFDNFARYWNGTAGSAYPRVIVSGEVTPLYCQQVWTLAERFAHKLGQIWGLEVKAMPKLEKSYPLNPVTKAEPRPVAPKVEVKPAPKVEAPKPVAKPVAPKAEPASKAQDFKTIIKAMKAAGVPADLILKTLESL